MEYASSYAIGAANGMGAQGAPSAHASERVLPPPKPDKAHWSTLLFGMGMVVLGIALVATIAGVPSSIGYDIDGPPARNKPSSNDPLAISRSIDGNMKWIDANSADAPDAYVGLIKQINDNEAAIPPMTQALAAMDASVRAIDGGLGELGTTTSKLGNDIGGMVDTSRASGDTMSNLAGDIGFLSSTMLELADATEELTRRMAAIEKQAGDIAKTGTSAALENTRELNANLPDRVPEPQTSGGGAAAAPAAGEVRFQ